MFGLAGKAFVLLTGALVLLNGVVNIFRKFPPLPSYTLGNRDRSLGGRGEG